MSGFRAPLCPRLGYPWSAHWASLGQTRGQAQGIGPGYLPKDVSGLCPFSGGQTAWGLQASGCFPDWENPYVTLYPEFEVAQTRSSGQMADKGYIYRGAKPVYCPGLWICPRWGWNRIPWDIPLLLCQTKVKGWQGSSRHRQLYRRLDHNPFTITASRVWPVGWMGLCGGTGSRLWPKYILQKPCGYLSS